MNSTKSCSPKGFERTLTASALRQLCGPSIATIRYVPIVPCNDGQQYVVKRFRNSLIHTGESDAVTEGSQKLWTGVGFGVSEAKGEFSALPAVPMSCVGSFGWERRGCARCKAECDWIRTLLATHQCGDAGSRRNRWSISATHFDSRPGVASNSPIVAAIGKRRTARLRSVTDLLR